MSGPTLTPVTLPPWASWPLFDGPARPRPIRISLPKGLEVSVRCTPSGGAQVENVGEALRIRDHAHEVSGVLPLAADGTVERGQYPQFPKGLIWRRFRTPPSSFGYDKLAPVVIALFDEFDTRDWGQLTVAWRAVERASRDRRAAVRILAGCQCAQGITQLVADGELPSITLETPPPSGFCPPHFGCRRQGQAEARLRSAGLGLAPFYVHASDPRRRVLEALWRTWAGDPPSLLEAAGFVTSDADVA